MSDLIITNGDAAADLLLRSGLAGRMLPWRDILHEGPVVRTEGHEALSDIRASYLSRRFGLPYAEVRADFVARDAVLRAHGLFDRVAIWVEHDLYDQLQLLQVLAFFAAENRSEGLVLVQAPDFISHQSPETVLRLAESAVDVTPTMLRQAAVVWQALITPTPRAIHGWLPRLGGHFPYLRPALERFLEELPASGSGLSRTERNLLSIIGAIHVTPRTLFGMAVEEEEAAFMGDWSLFRILEDLAFAREPLVAGLPGIYPCRGDPAGEETYRRAALALTPFGRSVLSGRVDAVDLNGIDRWWGGTHLSGHDCWRWDTTRRRLVPPAGSAGDTP